MSVSSEKSFVNERRNYITIRTTRDHWNDTGRDYVSLWIEGPLTRSTNELTIAEAALLRDQLNEVLPAEKFPFACAVGR